MEPEVQHTVVRMTESEEGDDNGDEEEDIPAVPVADMGGDEEPKKRGRPSGASRTSTPAKAAGKTPRSAKSTKSSKSAAATPSAASKKRKASDKADVEPAAKRTVSSGRAAASAAADAITEGSAKRHRAPNGSAKAVRICPMIYMFLSHYY